MNQTRDPLPRAESLQCPNCQQTGAFDITPATPTSRALYQCLQCQRCSDIDELEQPTNSNAMPDPHTMYAHMLQMTQKLDTVIKDVDNLREIVSNLQTVVEENVTLRNKLQDQEKVIEELKKRIDARHPPKQQQNPHNTGVTPTVPPNHPNRTTVEAYASQPDASPNSYAEVSRRFRPVQARSAKRIAASIRAFQATTGPQGYEYLYLPSRNRSTRQTTRQKLRHLGIETNRILDIYFPARGVVALLVHVQYQQELITKFRELNITPMTFNPLDPDHLNDPEYDGLSTMARESVMVGIHNTRMLRTLEHIGAPRSYPVGRSFVEKGWITIDELNRLARRDAARAFRPDDEMEETEDSEL
jgi:hypothetical protein